MQKDNSFFGPNLLVRAFFGATGGLVIALLASSLFHPPAKGVAVSGTLAWTANMASQEDRQKIFYLSFLLLAPFLSGLLAAAGKLSFQRGRLLVPGMAAFVPLFCWCAGNAFPANRSAAFLWSLCPLAFLSACFFIARPRMSSDEKTEILSRQLFPPWKPWSPANIIAGTLSAILLAAVIFPSDRDPLARAILATPEISMHVVSFLIGPATYQFHGGLVPGRDYFTQYSVGLPAIFFPLLGHSAIEALRNYGAFFSSVCFLFYLSFVLLAAWLYRSFSWALALAVFLFIMQCHCPFPFWDPSSFPLRYPLLAISAYTACRWAESASLLRTLCHGIVLGACVFTNTETGAYACLATVVLSLLGGGNIFTRLRGLAGAGGICLFSFAGFSAAAFGRQIFSIEYFIDLLQPLFLFSKGFGGWFFDWSTAYAAVINVVVPAVSAVTLGLFWNFNRSKEHREPDQRASALGYCAVLGLLMPLKYINMSLLGLWIENCPFSLLVLIFWIKAVFDVAKQSRQRVLNRCAFLVPASMAATALLLIFFFNDYRNPTEYGFRSYRAYPSLFNTFTGITKHDAAVPSLDLAQEDIRLITENTGPHDRVAIYDINDWAYLIAAGRSSHFPFLPSYVTFTEDQIQKSRKPVDRAFLPKIKIASSVPPEELISDLRVAFAEAGHGKYLVLLKRGSGSQPVPVK